MKIIHKKTKEVFVGDKLYVEKGPFGGCTETYVYLVLYPRRLLIIADDVDEEEALRRFKEKYDMVDE